MRTRSGEGWVWTTGGALAAVLAAAAALAFVVLANALPVFWPASLERVTLTDGRVFFGTRLRADVDPADDGARVQFRQANRDLVGSAEFLWVREDAITNVERPADAARIERRENGDLHAVLVSIAGADGETIVGTGDLVADLRAALVEVRRRVAREDAPLVASLAAQSNRLRALRMEALRLNHDLRAVKDPSTAARLADRLAANGEEEKSVLSTSGRDAAELARIRADIRRTTATFHAADGTVVELPLANIVRADWPNRMGFFGKCRYAAARLVSLLTDEPREANTEGGLLPAIFGTVLLVMLMAAATFPLGVMAGVYLREYARDTWFTRLVRVAVNNLAGIPSIVYGIFGLGFFVYGLGGSLDAWLYPERVEAGITTFGTGGVLWASMTLGILTLPVVIVATEEALATVPSELRQGALALGATPWQSLWRVLLPTASPGILTGFILAMARAAGEVAPLMLTGVVKSAPTLAIDGTWPFLHLERKFMHLGFHIYDIGFQSPNVEAARPMVYVTALLLLALVFVLNAAAIRLRNAMRRRYQSRSL